MKLSLASEGFMLALRAGGYSKSTIDLYRYVLEYLIEFLEDPEVEKIRLTDLNRYFVWLQEEYQPRRKSGDNQPLSGGTLQNHWTAIRSFFNWASENFRLKRRPDAGLRLPQNNPKIVHPLTQEEVRALLSAAEYTREANTDGRRKFKMRRRTADRDISLLLVLLDTGLRAGELGRLKIRDYDPKTAEIVVAPFGNSRRKTKSRIVHLGKTGQKALWRYLASRKDSEPDDPLFLSEAKRPMDTNSIRCLLVDLGVKAGIRNVHPHRLRHTFAIEYLRNGGDIFTLQRLLGHASLEMVQKYIELSAVDTREAHRKASPADKWKL
jgi:integrase/recombinase XerD